MGDEVAGDVQKETDDLLFFRKERKSGKEVIIALREDSGAAIFFHPSNGKWKISPQHSWLVMSDTNNFWITKEEAQRVYKDIHPDEELLNEIRDCLEIMKYYHKVYDTFTRNAPID